MTKVDVVRAEMVKAMKAGDKERKNALSMLLSALKNATIDKRSDLTEEEADVIVRKEIKQTQETLDTTPAERTEIIEECKFRIAVYEEFVPKMMEADAIEAVIKETLAELGIDAPTVKDKGKIMKVLMPKVKGKADGKLVAVMVRGDREVNETKVVNKLGGAVEFELAPHDELVEITHAKPGFAGPVGLDIDIFVDSEVALMKNMIVGANETDYHLENVNIGRDFEAAVIGDFRCIEEGDLCPVCKEEKIKTCRGIEVGHIFKLGTKYSKALECTFLDENGKEQIPIMGCYGIGVSRCIAAIIEQNSDENGIIWPMSVAPFHVIVVPVNIKDETQSNLAEKIYSELTGMGIETIIDDRNERAGVKFKDAELIGIPVRITVGKKAGEDIVEFKLRKGGEAIELSSEKAVKKAAEIVAEGLKS